MIPVSTITSNANSTPALTNATINKPLSKNSCSVIFAVASDFSNAVFPVAALHVNKSLSLFAQSSIIVLEKCPLMISSWCFSNNGRMIVFNSLESSNALIFAGFDKRSIIAVIPPCFKASVITSQPY